MLVKDELIRKAIVILGMNCACIYPGWLHFLTITLVFIFIYTRGLALSVVRLTIAHPQKRDNYNYTDKNAFFS